MSVYFTALIFGIVAGLRTVTAPAAVSWAARLGFLPLAGTGLAFLAHPISPIVFTVLALGEYVADKLPQTPSRRVPFQFGARLVSGGFCGAAVGLAHESLVGALVAGVVGSVMGTLAGSAARARLTRANGGKDWPVALGEDLLAIVLAALVVATLP